MKKRRFLAYIAAIVASVSVVVGCSDNNEPPFEPTLEPSGAETKNDSEYKYPTDTIIYVDERTEDEKEMLGGGFLIFKEESFKNYGVVVTRKVVGGKYEIYIPAEGVELNLMPEKDYWYEVSDFVLINNINHDLNFEEFGEMDSFYEDEHGNRFNYYYKLSNEYITITYDVMDALQYSIPQNTTGKEMRIVTGVTNPPYFNSGADIIFIQAAK